VQRETNSRFQALQRGMTARFESMDQWPLAADQRFEAMDKRFRTLQWTMGIGFSFLTFLMTVLKFWP